MFKTASVTSSTATLSYTTTTDGSPFLACDTGVTARGGGMRDRAFAAHIKKGFRYVLGRREQTLTNDAGGYWTIGVTRDLSVPPKAWKAASQEAASYLDENLRYSQEISAGDSARVETLTTKIENALPVPRWYSVEGDTIILRYPGRDGAACVDSAERDAATLTSAGFSVSRPYHRGGDWRVDVRASRGPSSSVTAPCLPPLR